MKKTNSEQLQEADELYEKYGKPFEKEHMGEFIAISPKGKVVLASSLLELAKKVPSEIGLGNYAYKVGQKVVGNLR